jgi:hypothetical protein
VPKSQRIVIDGQMKAIVTRFTEEGGVIHQVTLLCNHIVYLIT